ncbi:uncharacterized protein L969DRAFT_92396 [Mixia osmundae IAM 14324]|uniref:Uncharacterized protein n=1 Tax=Mixia osmundae (strain CBS 9802 / IAM 14324 / JCM 22182 / KY 12970) TaxID=764103 RepID=G7DXN4_MIXOS|nr:uncharacterized protein L969DRAFT_92396 [Mixia osmundae IAM 14324]KEI41163.1 hypothetical protein L969DRAFT_92396 [Mixia osmundae IAM 14324]GAA95344.1 hypothetical protein E5Q_02001 [Mixia osmundae IAM 14324]
MRSLSARVPAATEAKALQLTEAWLHVVQRYQYTIAMVRDLDRPVYRSADKDNLTGARCRASCCAQIYKADSERIAQWTAAEQAQIRPRKRNRWVEKAHYSVMGSPADSNVFQTQYWRYRAATLSPEEPDTLSAGKDDDDVPLVELKSRQHRRRPILLLAAPDSLPPKLPEDHLWYTLLEQRRRFAIEMYQIALSAVRIFHRYPKLDWANVTLPPPPTKLERGSFASPVPYTAWGYAISDIVNTHHATHRPFNYFQFRALTLEEMQNGQDHGGIDMQFTEKDAYTVSDNDLIDGYKMLLGGKSRWDHYRLRDRIADFLGPEACEPVHFGILPWFDDDSYRQSYPRHFRELTQRWRERAEEAKAGWAAVYVLCRKGLKVNSVDEFLIHNARSAWKFNTTIYDWCLAIEDWWKDQPDVAMLARMGPYMPSSTTPRPPVIPVKGGKFHRLAQAKLHELQGEISVPGEPWFAKHLFDRDDVLAQSTNGRATSAPVPAYTSFHGIHEPPAYAQTIRQDLAACPLWEVIEPDQEMPIRPARDTPHLHPGFIETMNDGGEPLEWADGADGRTSTVRERSQEPVRGALRRTVSNDSAVRSGPSRLSLASQSGSQTSTELSLPSPEASTSQLPDEHASRSRPLRKVVSVIVERLHVR